LQETGKVDGPNLLRHQYPKIEHILPLYAPSRKFLLGDQTNT